MLLDYARRFVRGTTLVAPWGWALAALAALLGVELAAVVATAEGPSCAGQAPPMLRRGDRDLLPDHGRAGGEATARPPPGT